jgi:hypothetical protein
MSMLLSAVVDCPKTLMSFVGSLFNFVTLRNGTKSVWNRMEGKVKVFGKESQGNRIYIHERW